MWQTLVGFLRNSTALMLTAIHVTALHCSSLLSAAHSLSSARFINCCHLLGCCFSAGSLEDCCRLLGCCCSSVLDSLSLDHEEWWSSLASRRACRGVGPSASGSYSRLSGSDLYAHLKQEVLPDWLLYMLVSHATGTNQGSDIGVACFAQKCRVNQVSSVDSTTSEDWLHCVYFPCLLFQGFWRVS